MNYRGIQSSPERPLDEQLISVVNAILKGRLNVTLDVTLTANAATTTVTDARLSSQSFIGLMPKTANAAAALGTTYVSSRLEKSCVLTHANNAQTDRDFTLLIIG